MNLCDEQAINYFMMHQSSWFKACNARYERDHGAAWMHRQEKEVAACEVIPLGPWIFWSKDECEAMETWIE